VKEIGLKYIRAVRNNTKNAYGVAVRAGFYIVETVLNHKKMPKKINYGIGEAKGHGEMLAVCNGFKPKLPKELKDELFVATIDNWGIWSIDEISDSDIQILNSEQEYNEWLNEING